jgi:hypothetical protein
MMRLIPVLVVAAAVALCGSASLGNSPGSGATTKSAARDSEFSAQKRRGVRKRAPTRIRVRPFYRHYPEASEFPRPDDVSAPGPGAVRQCRSWLAREYRPSGTVIVPHMRCWWERG